LHTISDLYFDRENIKNHIIGTNNVGKNTFLYINMYFEIIILPLFPSLKTQTTSSPNLLTRLQCGKPDHQ